MGFIQSTKLLRTGKTTALKFWLVSFLCLLPCFFFLWRWRSNRTWKRVRARSFLLFCPTFLRGGTGFLQRASPRAFHRLQLLLLLVIGLQSHTTMAARRLTEGYLHAQRFHTSPSQPLASSHHLWTPFSLPPSTPLLLSITVSPGLDRFPREDPKGAIPLLMVLMEHWTPQRHRQLPHCAKGDDKPVLVAPRTGASIRVYTQMFTPTPTTKSPRP